MGDMGDTEDSERARGGEGHLKRVFFDFHEACHLFPPTMTRRTYKQRKYISINSNYY